MIMFVIGVIVNVIIVIAAIAALWLYANLFALLSIIAIKGLKENLSEEVELKIVMIVEVIVMVIFAIVVFCDFVLK